MERSTITCAFSLFDEGRKYSGNHRRYLVENAREICYSPATREKIKLREALGFYGHGRRILSGKVAIQEVEIATLPDGTQAIISNIPSNVTTAFDVADDGTVTHSQEILDTEPGRIVSGLHTSKIGGFSWACKGQDPDRARSPNGATRLSGFSGFDYVLTPGFSANRGYILESAAGTEQHILESIAATVGSDERARQYVAGWNLDHLSRIQELEDAIFESESREAELFSSLHQHEKALADAVLEKEKALFESAKTRGHYQELLKALTESFPFFIPENIMHDMLEGDFSRAKHIFESATHLDFTQFPLRPAQGRQHSVMEVAQQREEPDYGTAGYGFAMKL